MYAYFFKYCAMQCKTEEYGSPGFSRADTLKQFSVRACVNFINDSGYVSPKQTDY